MPGPVSDSYDPEWGTTANGDPIRDALQSLYVTVSAILGNQPPLPILDLVHMKLPEPIAATLTTKQWRLLRFALERAIYSI
jgi:hypothetical protein